jgi:hypothetical protein
MTTQIINRIKMMSARFSKPNKERGVSKTPDNPPNTKASFDHNFIVCSPFPIQFIINLFIFSYALYVLKLNLGGWQIKKTPAVGSFGDEIKSS